MSKKGDNLNSIPEDMDFPDQSPESQSSSDFPSNKKIPKRQRAEMTEEEGIAEIIRQYQTNSKKNKVEVNYEACKESRQKVLDVMNHQLETRKEESDNLLKNLSEVMIHLEANCNAMEDNKKKLDFFTGAHNMCMQQAAAAYEQNLKCLKDIHASFKKQCEEMELNHKTENVKIVDELENDIKKLEQKTILETKRSGRENLHKTILNAMQNDF